MTQVICDEICLRLASGESLVSICKSEHIPERATILLWVVMGERGDVNHKSFSDSYARAREAQSHALLDDVIEISDDSSGDTTTDRFGNQILDAEFAARSRLRIEARLKVAARMHVERFGEKVTAKLTGDKANPVAVQIIDNVPRDDQED